MLDEHSGLPNRAQDFAARATSYHHFMLGLKWVMLSLGVTIIFLTVTFATTAGFAGGLAVGLVVFLIGVWALNNGLNHSSERENGDPTQA